MSWSPEDDEKFPPRRPGTRFSQSLCSCDMCEALPAEQTDLDVEDYQ